MTSNHHTCQNVHFGSLHTTAGFAIVRWLQILQIGRRDQWHRRWFVTSVCDLYAHQEQHALDAACSVPKVISLTGLRATHTCCTATRTCAAIVGGLSLSQIWTAIWPRRCYMGLLSRLLDGQSMTSTSWSSFESLVARAVFHFISTHTPKVTTHSAVVTSSSLRQYRSY